MSDSAVPEPYYAAQGLYSAAMGTYYAAQGIYCGYAAYAGCWLLPRIQIIRPGGGNTFVPRPHTYNQMAESRIQDPRSSIQDTGIKGYKCKDTRIQE